MQKIIIKNFGPVEEAEVELGKFTIFVGEPASGKSTIAKLIYFFKSFREDLKEFILYTNEPIAGIKPIQDKFALYFGSSQFFSNDFDVKYYYSNQKYIHLYRKEKLQVDFEPSFFKSIKQELQPLSSILRRSSNGMLDLVVQDLEKKLDGIFEDTRTVQFIPAVRSFTSSFPASVRTELIKEIGRLQADKNQMQAKIDLFLMVDFEKRVQTLLNVFEMQGGTFNQLADKINSDNFEEISILTALELVRKILRGKYQVRNGSESILVEGREKPIFLNQASSGQQEVIRLLQEFFLAIVQKEDQFKVLEEPEAHLSPHRQNLLVQLMIEMLNLTKSELLVTTHSDHIINAILLGAKKFQSGDYGGINHSDIKIYYFDSEKDEDSQKHKTIHVPVLPGGRIQKPPAGFFDQIGKDLRILIS
jgi:AAA15 family ATPase/GTPase